MKKEELIQFLKDNLEIKIDIKAHNDYYHGVTGYDVIVTLLLENEEISTSSDTFDVK